MTSAMPATADVAQQPLWREYGRWARLCHRIGSIAFGMTNSVRISPLATLGSAIEPLRAEAARQGFRFVERLVAEWESGANRFDRPGEGFFGAFSGKRLVGVGGLNHDPYANADAIGRVRHVYVLASDRRLGIGTALVDHILAKARSNFSVVRLRTDTPEAALFYLRLGFTPIKDEAASHIKLLHVP